jgi:hypothetical protein
MNPLREVSRRNKGAEFEESRWRSTYAPFPTLFLRWFVCFLLCAIFSFWPDLFFGVRRSVLDFLRGRSFKKNRDCRCVELRALCDEVPRTPPGPEGSNGTGITSCAAEYPKFLSSAARRFFAM